MKIPQQIPQEFISTLKTITQNTSIEDYLTIVNTFDVQLVGFAIILVIYTIIFFFAGGMLTTTREWRFWVLYFMGLIGIIIGIYFGLVNPIWTTSFNTALIVLIILLCASIIVVIVTRYKD